MALVHFMVLGSRAPWAPNTINICWAPEMSWAPIASKFLFGSNGSPTNFGSPADIGGVGSPGRPDGGGGLMGAQGAQSIGSLWGQLNSGACQVVKFAGAF